MPAVSVLSLDLIVFTGLILPRIGSERSADLFLLPPAPRCLRKTRGTNSMERRCPEASRFFHAAFIDFWRGRELIFHTVKRPLDHLHPGAGRLLHEDILRNTEDATFAPHAAS